jgi:hypothetical protein
MPEAAARPGPNAPTSALALTVLAFAGIGLMLVSWAPWRRIPPSVAVAVRVSGSGIQRIWIQSSEER